jgi:hypothetical protein
MFLFVVKVFLLLFFMLEKFSFLFLIFYAQIAFALIFVIKPCIPFFLSLFIPFLFFFYLLPLIAEEESFQFVFWTLLIYALLLLLINGFIFISKVQVDFNVQLFQFLFSIAQPVFILRVLLLFQTITSFSLLRPIYFFQLLFIFKTILSIYFLL